MRTAAYRSKGGLVIMKIILVIALVMILCKKLLGRLKPIAGKKQ